MNGIINLGGASINHGFIRPAEGGMTAVALQRLEEQLPDVASGHVCEVGFTCTHLYTRRCVSDHSAGTQYRAWILPVGSHPAQHPNSTSSS